MTFGVSSADKRGQMWLFSSKDMVRWEYERVLFQHPDPDVFMLECPDFFPIKDKDGNEKWVIGFSAMGSKPSGFMNRNVSNAGYMIGTWEPGGEFKPETEFRLWDCGHNYYAPQSFNVDGRQIVYGWMSRSCSRFPWRMTAGVASSPCRARSPLAMTATWSPRRSPKWKACARIPSTMVRSHSTWMASRSSRRRRGRGNRNDHRLGCLHCRACGSEDSRH